MSPGAGDSGVGAPSWHGDPPGASVSCPLISASPTAPRRACSGDKFKDNRNLSFNRQQLLAGIWEERHMERAEGNDSRIHQHPQLCELLPRSVRAR